LERDGREELGKEGRKAGWREEMREARHWNTLDVARSDGGELLFWKLNRSF
jgi:hypothetical protein